MTVKNTDDQKRMVLVKSLANSIQDKIVHPATEKTELVRLEITGLGNKLTSLEQELSRLTGAHGQTRVLAAVSMAGLIMLAIILAFLK